MKDIEFVKLRHWLDGELTLIRVLLAILLGYQIDKTWVWWVVSIYCVFSLIYAATRIAWVESVHKGYTIIPPNRVDYE